MVFASQWVERTLGFDPAVQSKIVTSLLAVFILWILHLFITRVIVPRIQDIYIRYRIRKTSGYIIVIIGILVVGRIWFRGFQALATYLGILSAGLAIALRDPLVNLAGWVFIIWRRPFEVGDRIEIGGRAGDVIDIRIFQFTLMEIGNWVDAEQSTGRVVHIPNGCVFTDALANYSKGFHYIWNEITVLITFESDWEKAKGILHRIAAEHAEELSRSAEERVREAARRFMIFYSKLTPTVYTSVKDSGVRLTIRYLCEPRRRRGSEEVIWEDILREFAKCEEISFAYPTRRYYNHLLESRSEDRPAPPGENPTR